MSLSVWPEVKKSPREDMKNVTDACTVDPCEAGKCTLNKLLGYRCACPVGKAGTLCNESELGEIFQTCTFHFGMYHVPIQLNV